MDDGIRWNGLNLRAVAVICRDLLAWNASHPGNPRIWYVGRSRVEPEKNVVRLRTPKGVVTVRVGDWIVRGPTGEIGVEPGDGSCRRCMGTRVYSGQSCALCGGEAAPPECSHDLEDAPAGKFKCRKCGRSGCIREGLVCWDDSEVS